VATFKSEAYRFLRLGRPTDDEFAHGARYPAGYVHLPQGLEAECVKQLVAEQLVTVKTRRGFQRLEWQKIRERNEVLDCRVYARAAGWIVGADRWPDATWRGLEQQLGVAARSMAAATEPAHSDMPLAPPATPTAGNITRRVFRRGVRPNSGIRL
jgi:phage terminase large subunit GpA-like protein